MFGHEKDNCGHSVVYSSDEFRIGGWNGLRPPADIITTEGTENTENIYGKTSVNSVLSNERSECVVNNSSGGRGDKPRLTGASKTTARRDRKYLLNKGILTKREPEQEI